MLQIQLVKNLGVGAALEGDAVWAASSLTDADPEIQTAAQRTTASESHSAAIAIRDEVRELLFNLPVEKPSRSANNELAVRSRLSTFIPNLGTL